jgi:hypothetical protein
MIAARRQFLKTGLAGSLLLGCAGWLNAAGARPLSDAEREMLGALMQRPARRGVADRPSRPPEPDRRDRRRHRR